MPEPNVRLEFHPDFMPPNPPTLSTSGVAAEHMKAANSLEGKLRDLGNAVNSVVAAIALYGYCKGELADKGPVVREWKLLAGRSGAMGLRDFGTALQSIRALVGRIPGWVDRVDVKKLREAEKTFIEKFPAAHKLRHSVAHPEHYTDPSKKMGIDDKAPSRPDFIDGAGYYLQMQSTFVDDNFSATFDGEYITYEMGDVTGRLLVDITRDCFRAFEKLDRFHQMKSGHGFRRDGL